MNFDNLIRQLRMKVERQRKALQESEELLKATESLAAAAARAPK